MTKPKEPSSKERYEQYESAKKRADVVNPYLDEAYRFVLPDKDDFFDESVPRQGELKIFDSTAVEANVDFANNLQRLLMPPYTEWFSYVSGEIIDDDPNLSDDEKQQVKQILQEQTKKVFRIIDDSNLSTTINMAFQDMGVSTGVLIINEGDDKNPIQFVSVSMKEIVFDVGINGEMENFWFARKIKARKILRKWPKATLSDSLQNTIKTNPDTEVMVIEGAIFIYENSDDAKFLYYVQLEENKTDIFKEFRAFSPFIGFRLNVAPGEIYGRGPARNLLPKIRVLNKNFETKLRVADLMAFPILLRDNTGVLDLEATRKIEAGSVIDIEPSLGGKDPIRQLPIQVNLQNLEISSDKMQDEIRTGFNANPLPPSPKTPNISATEINMREQQWLRKSSASIIRVIDSLFELVDKITRILRKKGILKDLTYKNGILTFEMGNKNIRLDYRSPILDLQKKDDIGAFEAYLQFLIQNFSEVAVAPSVKMTEIPIWAADKFNVDQKLINSPETVKQKLGEIAQTAQQQQDAKDQSSQQPPPPGTQGSPATATGGASIL